MLFTLQDSCSQGEGCHCSGCGWELSIQKKRARLIEEGNTVPPLPIPTEIPPLGWTEITADNYPKCSSALSNILPGELYRYMALGVSYEGSSGRFRALIRGYIFWASGRVQSVAIYVQNPCICFVRGRVFPLMKDYRCMW